MKAVFGRGNKREKGERQDDVSTFSQVLGQLEKEVQILNSEKEYLLSTERLLLFLMNEEIEAKRRKNQELRLEVEKQKANCVELERVLKAFIKESYSIP